MAAEVGDEEVPELRDFTTQTPWERFQASVVVVLSEWGRSRRGSDDGPPTNGRETGPDQLLTLPAAGSYYSLSWHPASSASASRLGRCPESHFGVGAADGPLASMAPEDRVCACFPSVVGASGFLLMAPTAASTSADDAALVLGALCSAARESAGWSEVLAFVAYGRDLLLGQSVSSRAESAGRPAMFWSEELPEAPMDLRFLSAIHSAALAKLAAEARVREGREALATSRVAVQHVHGEELERSEQWGAVVSDRGPPLFSWGSLLDPVTGLLVVLQWCHREPLEDTNDSTDYRADTASRWILRCSFAESSDDSICSLARFLPVRTPFPQPFHSAPSSVLTRLPAAQDGSLSTFQNQRGLPQPTPMECLKLLDGVFEAARDCDYGRTAGKTPSRPLLSGIRGAEPDSLLECLVVAMLDKSLGLSGVAAVWSEFVHFVRLRIESGVPLPGVSSTPDASSCIVQQKLQMLNFCLGFTQLVPGSRLARATTQRQGGASASRNRDWRDHDKGRPLVCPPYLQNPGVMTGDSVSELQDLMTRLGDGPDAAGTKLKLQSAQLVSDMQAFKAANNGCMFEEFIQWYSPVDWDPVKGELSVRMAQSSEWHTLWEMSQPLPAKQQPPLFDKVRETAKALHVLETLPPRDLFRQLIDVALVALLSLFSPDQGELANHAKPALLREICPCTEASVEALRKAVCCLWADCDPEAVGAARKLEDVWTSLSELEYSASRFASLSSKLSSNRRLVEALLSPPHECLLETLEERFDAVSSVSESEDLLSVLPDLREFDIDLRSSSPSSFRSLRLHSFVRDRFLRLDWSLQ